MAELVEEQNSAFQDIENFMRNLRKDNHVTKSRLKYWTKRQLLFDELWSKIRSRHDKLLTAKSVDKKLAENEYFKNNIFSQISEACLAYSLDIEEESLKFIPGPCASTPTVATQAAPQPAPRIAEVRLPPIDLPHFNGDFKEWIHFRDTFISLVDSKHNLSRVDKLNYLKSCLIGAAKGFLDSYTITDANYELAWKELKDTYNNNRKLISAQILSIIDAPILQRDSASDLKKLVHQVKRALQALNSLDISTDKWDPFLVVYITRRLPSETLRGWEQSLESPTNFPSWKQLLQFLEDRYRTLEAVEDSLLLSRRNVSNVSHSHQTRGAPTPKPRTIKSCTTTTVSCTLCRSNTHKLGHSCDLFKSMSLDSRWDFVKSLHLCFNCLGNHSINKCDSRSCLVCGSKHHSLLHRDFTQNLQPRPKPGTSPQTALISKASLVGKSTKPQKNVTKMNESSSTNVTSALTSLAAQCPSSQGIVLLGTILLRAENNGKVVQLRALLDTASQASFITERARKLLGAKPKSTKISISGIGQTNACLATKEVSFNISPHQGNEISLPIKCIVIPKIVDLQSDSYFNSSHLSGIKHLNLADPQFNKVSRIDILLGADVYGEVVTGRTLKGQPTQPTALESHFGWILIGRVSSPKKSSNVKALVSCIQLQDQLKQFWEIEEVDPQTHASEEDQYCEEHFVKTHSRSPDGRYTVELPFRSDPPNLGESLNVATKRYRQVENNLRKKGELQNYCTILKEYIDLNHVDKVSSSRSSQPGPHCFLPHHAVFKESSSSTRLRIVFDASCQTSNGRSLNDNLYSGPKLQNDLTHILVRWRFHQFVLIADISKMYRQISVAAKHRDFQRILLREHPESDVQEYNMNRVTFGVNCAPFLAIRVLHQLSDDEAHRFPKAGKIVKSDMYVDDVLTGASSIEEAQLIQEELIRLCETGKFELRKWGSNSTKLLEPLPEEFINPQFHFQSNDCNLKTLGIVWEPKTDLFTFRIKPHQFGNLPVTKRKVLSIIAQIYDPVGWLAPVIIRCKIFMQQLWLHKYDWDDPLPSHLVESWDSFSSDFQSLENINIPRWYNYAPSYAWEIHGFCDASERAYAAAIYFRMTNLQGITHSHLVISKTKVAPLKTVSLPRLELCGAVLLTRLLTKLAQTISFPSVVWLWTDSTIVLSWLVRSPHTLKTFVANRVSEIQAKTENYQWKHVKSKDNPADLASRGTSTQELLRSSLWWAGPSWLSQSCETWPKQPDIHPTIEEIKSQQLASLIVTKEPEFCDRFSSFSKMLRIVSYMNRFSSPKYRTSTLILHAKEVKNARNVLIRITQAQYFPSEVKSLCQQNPVSPDSLLRTFNPYLDENLLIRSKSRILHSELPFNEKCPIILPCTATFTVLYVREVHQITLHGNKQLMINVIRRNFWIPRVSRLVKSIIHNCVTCSRFKQETRTQIMAPLPSQRLCARHCFATVGMDYCGPFIHKLFEGRCPRTSKCYILIIVCFVSRMTHLELVSDLTTESFLAAFERFIARRSLPSHVHCDNATYFVGANTAIQKQLSIAVKEAASTAANVFAPKGIQFHFSPPQAPHFNGMAEAGVKSVKYHLKRVIGAQLFTFEKYCTLLTKIEACLNSRPLAPLNDDPEDLTALTPAHLWMGKDLLTINEKVPLDQPIVPTKYWAIVEQSRQHFWKRWSQEYLHSLKARYKWPTQQDNARVGQMVLLLNELTPPQQWKLGRITEVHPGLDGQVRVVTVKCANNSYKRAITKLVFLPFSHSD